MIEKKQKVMSGIRPTGFLHLGNYFGAIRNYVRMQNEFECFFMVADLHSLTTHPDTKELKNNVHRVLAENIACGLDPDKAALYCQSHVHETPELYLYLNMLAYTGELEKTVTFKEKVRLQPNNVNAGLLTYPVLQAADILIHRASLVPVGKERADGSDKRGADCHHAREAVLLTLGTVATLGGVFEFVVVGAVHVEACA